MSAGEGRGRLDRSEPGHMRSRRSPDRCERREDHYDSYDDDAWDLRSREQPTDTIILKASFRCAVSPEAVLFSQQRAWPVPKYML